MNDIVTSIRNSEHYPAGVFIGMELAVVPNETYFLVLNIRAGQASLDPRFTYGMAALVVRGLRLWLSTHALSQNWPKTWVGVLSDDAVIGQLDYGSPVMGDYTTNEVVQDVE